jgi:uncharacterized membrane protein
MKMISRTLTGAVLAAAAMYWLDPASGRRRRARLGDQLQHMLRKVGRGLDASGRDLVNRMQGFTAQTLAAFDGAPIEEGILAERVRSILGRVVSHPGAIDVAVKSGRVALTGTILAKEVPALMRAVRSVRGVEDAQVRLTVHESARSISALQGGRERRPPRFELLQESWSPGTRLLMSGVGLLLLGRGVGRPRGTGLVGCVVGGALLTRAGLNVPLSKLAGANAPAIQIRKTLHVHAPVERVFDVLSRYESFPLFMRNVRSVRTNADGTSHWCVVGPMGTTMEWNAETVRFEPNSIIEWRTAQDALVRHAGSICFRGENGHTCLDIQMCYSPPAGVFGHGVARLLGVDPKRELDDDLMRLKSFLETGKAARDAAARGSAAPPATVS